MSREKKLWLASILGTIELNPLAIFSIVHLLQPVVFIFISLRERTYSQVPNKRGVQINRGLLKILKYNKRGFKINGGGGT